MSTNNLASFFERKFILFEFSFELPINNSLCSLILPSISGSNMNEARAKQCVQWKPRGNLLCLLSSEHLSLFLLQSHFFAPPTFNYGYSLCLPNKLLTDTLKCWNRKGRNGQAGNICPELRSSKCMVSNWQFRQRSINILPLPTPLKDCRAIYTVQIKAVDGL